MNKDLLKYLQQDGIGKVIAKGLADVYTNKPSAPVKYLAAWLKNYSSNQKEIAKLSAEETIKASKLKQHNLSLEEEKKKEADSKKKEEKENLELKDFENKVQNDQYQKELLFHELPEFVEKKLKLTGAYVGYIKHPPREVTDEDQDDNAHLDTSQPKMINYIGASHSHAALMIGKTLPLDKGVTAGALSLSLDDPVPAQDGTVEVKDKYIYIGNVVKNENMNYFRLPKLGAYIAVPLVYQSYLTEHIFDVALESRQKYLNDLDQFEKAKAQALKELETEIQNTDQKLADAKQKNDQAAIETATNELTELAKKKRQKVEQTLEEEKIELPIEKKEFVVCGDTMGKDVEISKENRDLLTNLVKHFKNSWEAKEKQLLYKDVNYQINILKGQQEAPEKIIENLENRCELSPENKSSIEEIEDQTLKEYKKLTWQIEALKKQLQNNQLFLGSFFKLKNFRVVKFRSLIQTLLYFLRYEKSTINQANKTRLDWKKVQKNYLYAETYFAFINYNSEGPKTEPYPFYCKINHIKQKLDKYSEPQVFKYNVGLGAILNLVKKQIAHRIANIELRRSQKEKEREARAQLLEENEKIAEEKRQALDKHKQSLSGQDVEAFNEEEWSAKYDEENPLKEIPPEIVDDIDNDF